MRLRAVVLAGIAAGLLSADAAWAAIHCGGYRDFFDWECRFTPRHGWNWRPVQVGQETCECGADSCVLENGYATNYWNFYFTQECGGGHSCSNQQHPTLPPSDPCTGPVPPADREGFVIYDGKSDRYTPDERSSYNSTGGKNEINRTLQGVYSVTFPGLGGLDGNVQVDAYGSRNERCKISEWSGMPDLSVRVVCEAPGVGLVDTPFLAYFFATDDLATSTREIGHARFDFPVDPGQSPVDPVFQWNSKGVLPITTQVATGSYLVRFPNVVHADAAAIVTALGAGPDFCQVLSTAVSSSGGQSGTNVGVQCFDENGRLDDSGFTLRLEWQRASGSKVGEGYAYANQPGSTVSYPPAGQFNSTGATNIAARSATGTYSMTYPNLPPPPFTPPGPYDPASTVLMSARGGVPAYCKVSSWIASGSGTKVNGMCFDFSGKEMNSGYQLVYLTRERQPPESQ
jgi:hypothetical protein